METKYYICNIFGDVIVDKDTYKLIDGGIKVLAKKQNFFNFKFIIMKDIITGTILVDKPFSLATHDSIYGAAYKKMINKSSLVVVNKELLSKENMKEILKSMTKEDIEAYVNKINELKGKYSDALDRVRKEERERRKEDRIIEDSISKEAGRIRKIGRRLY